MKPIFLLLKKILLPICGTLALAAPLTAVAQQMVFNDTFANSTVESNSVPGGTPTASSTSYDTACAKSLTPSTIGLKTVSGHFYLNMVATSAAYQEAQAVFSSYPIKLASAGDVIEVQYIFTDTTNFFNGLMTSGGGSSLAIGLYYSGGSAPYTNLYNNGLQSATTAQATGGVQNWLGYRVNLAYGSTTATSSRPAQNQGNNLNQALLNGFAGGQNLGQNTTSWAALTVGNQYTMDETITLQPNGSLAITNTLYAGAGTGGTGLATNVATASGANILTTNFDALMIGGERTGGTITTNDINQIIVKFTSTNQAGPYFTLTSSGTGCGGATIGLNGSVTTNAYLLYTNGVFNGNSVVGSGSAITFGSQTAPAVYTIYASNLVTARVGPMFGSQTVSQTAPVITSQPSSFSCVTNAPASFSVAATGNTLTYQWYKNGVALTNGGDFSGVTTTNLVIPSAHTADAATTANGYYVVVQDPCSDSVTSAPNASLTLLAPNNLVWQGGNPNNNWDSATTLNFTNAAGAFEAFTNGDNVTFDDTSANPTVIISNSLVPTSITVNGTQSYLFGGSGSITGFGKLVDINTGTLTITNNNLTYTGGTIVSNGATLALGDGSSINGSISGAISINSNSVLHVYHNNDANLAYTLSGNGTVQYDISTGNHTYTIPVSAISSNFAGTNIIDVGVRLHSSDNNAGYPMGNGSVVIVNSGAQAWCDRSATTYNNTFYIAGNGWFGSSPQSGAISVFGNTFNGAINLMANARIGGTIAGGTILCPIAGSYQLEIWGTAGSYILSMGPTNGVHSYASTLITSGSVLALNTNAISTGPLTMDLAGDLRLNGNNLTVSNLSSINSGQVTGTGATVQNTSSSTAATLTVGADNSNTEFDGIFTNGGSASLGLTKVGSGAFTVTGVNFNTGAVAVNGGTLLLSGSGSFNNASVIAPASGATYDVSGAGGTLTLNSGQTLKGSGTVNGNVSASAGSTINPGDTIGALTVSGNLTLAGAMLMELNRTNTPATNDSIVVSGTLTAGGTLTVTNRGPALHTGDSFQLFGGGVSGFTAVTLQTNDVANNVNYTWNNTIGANGTITVASVISLVNTNAPKIQVSVSGNILSVAWPTNAGWTLLTNSVGLTATTQWFPYPNSANLTNVNITISPAKTNVFFKMAYPYP